MTTIGFESEWSGILAGKRETKLVRCPKCGGIRMDLGGPHAPQLSSAGPIDCVGDVVIPARTVA